MDAEKPDMKKDLTRFALLIIFLVTVRNGCAGSSAQSTPDYQPSQAAIELQVFQDSREKVVNSHLTDEDRKEIDDYGKLLRRAWIK